MKKNVYSLVLMEDLIAEVDKLAYSLNTSRSNLINQILAEKLKFMTPEMHMRSIFDEIENLLRENHRFRIQEQGSHALLTIRSVLRYKYNPTIKYVVTLYQFGEEKIGDLRIVSRTQSEGLQKYLNHFFMLWNAIEKQFQFPGFKVDEGVRWLRVFKGEAGKDYSSSEIAEGVAGYIQCIDEALGIYFSCFDEIDVAESKIYYLYRKYIQNAPIFI